MTIIVLIILILTLTTCFFYVKNIIKVNVKGDKAKALVSLILILVIAGIFYLSMEFLYPRDFQNKVSIGGNISISELGKDNNYYISYDKIKLKCTKEQYDFLVNGNESYIYYRLNFFYRNIGKILEVDDKPIYYGSIQGPSNI